MARAMRALVVGLVAAAAAIGPAAASSPFTAASSVNAASSTAASSTAASRTAVRHLRPVTSSGALAAGFEIRNTLGDANCASGSPTTGTSYQCFEARYVDGILDSCWVMADPSYTACLVKPWQHKVIRLRVNRGYDTSSGFTDVHQPWGLRLSSGRRCLVEVGSVRSTHGHPISYYCDKKTVISGSIRKGSGTWHVSAYRNISPKGKSPISCRPAALAW